MDWKQSTVTIETSGSKSVLITDQIIDACPDLARIQVGMLHLFLRHTSASLTINENADVDVRRDLDMALHHIVPDRLSFRHSMEGRDDMPAHVKSSLMGVSLQIPISEGRLMLGTWQGIYLCEHRSLGHRREIICTLYGQA
jgi:secondary thiamine-phosphate synthase enzyme